MKIKDIPPLKEIRKTEEEVKKTTITLILGGFGVVAALAWNDAIQNVFNYFLPKSSGLIGKFLYAIIATIIVVILSSQLKKTSEREQQ